MKIGKTELDLKDAINYANNDSIILKRRENNLLLSDFQIDVLKSNGIDYLNYSNLSLLLFDIEEMLNANFDDNLDLVSSQISEMLYYNSTNK